MRSSRTRSRLSTAALTFLAAMTSGCICPGTRGINPIGEWICVKPPVVSTITDMRCTDRCPAAGWQVRYGTVDSPAAALKPNGAQSLDAATAGAGRPKADAHADIVAAQSGLTINVIDLADPVPKGDELTFKIIVSNDGTLSERNVSVVATVPRGMIPVPIDAGQPGGGTITGQIVRFDPVAEIRPGERREYRVIVRTLRAGQLAFRAELTSDNLLQSLGAEATTEVIP